MPKVGKTERQPKVVSGNGYCRMCQETKSLSNFYEATNPMIDKNGFLSVCKDCCNLLYDNYFAIYNNMETAMKLTCRDLDILFNLEVLKQAQNQQERFITQGKKADKVFGYYKSKLSTTGKNNERIDSFRYKDSNILDNQNQNIICESLNIDLSSDFELTDEIIRYWGKGRENWEYEFLEEEIFRLKTDFECPDYGMAMIMKDICFINLDIERIRQGLDKGDITKLIESRSKLMNDGNLKPVQSTGADKNEKMSLGVFIKKWENEKPVRTEIDDEMKRYIDTYMIGHLAKMEGLNNDTVRFYEESIKDFTIDFADINSEEDDE